MLVLALGCVSTTSCRKVELKLGTRVLVNQLFVNGVSAALPDGPGIAPGEKSALVVTVTEPDGTVWTTEGRGKGKLLWSDLVVTGTVVSVNKKGIVTLPADPRLTEGMAGHVVITAPTQSALHAELDIPIRYDYTYRASFSGGSGSSGLSGSNGSDGSSGSSGSTDPEHPSAGGNGSSGGNGSDGQDGGSGGDGPDVLIRMALHPGPKPLVEVAVSAGRGSESLYLIDPQGGSIIVSSSGGSGGSGGKGGSGGRGGSGGSGIPPGSSGSDGSSGRDGNSGHSGSDGSVTVVYDPSTAPYLSVVRISSGGHLEYEQKPVAPLW